jgi:Tfp pilus assembly protein PilZ
MQPQMMGGIIQVNIPDKATLQSSYMPFVQGGGLFVPTKQAVKMGQEVFVLATLHILNHKALQSSLWEKKVCIIKMKLKNCWQELRL